MDDLDEGTGLGVSAFAVALAMIVDVKLGNASWATGGVAASFALAAALVIAARRRGWSRFARRAASTAAILATAAAIALVIVHAGGLGRSFVIQLALVVGALGTLSLLESMLARVSIAFRDRIGPICFMGSLVVVIGSFLTSLVYRWLLGIAPESSPITFWFFSVLAGIGFFLYSIAKAVWRAGHRRA